MPSSSKMEAHKFYFTQLVTCPQSLGRRTRTVVAVARVVVWFGLRCCCRSDSNLRVSWSGAWIAVYVVRSPSFAF